MHRFAKAIPLFEASITEVAYARDVYRAGKTGIVALVAAHHDEGGPS